MSDQWTLVVDVSLCINCHNCVLATKDEHVGNSFAGYSAAQPAEGLNVISIERHVRGNGSMVDVTYVPKACNHCDDAPCIAAAGSGAAIYKRADGIVIIDPEKARGRRDLVDACPYGMIHWNEESSLPQHWTFDAHLLDAGWAEPRAVQACPTRALTAVKSSTEALRRQIEAESLRTLESRQGARPRTLYRNLDKVRTHFLGGNLVGREAPGRTVNLAGVEISLSGPRGSAPRTTTTDSFGDFKFDGMIGDSEPFTLHAAMGGALVPIASGLRQGSVYLGSLMAADAAAGGRPAL